MSLLGGLCFKQFASQELNVVTSVSTISRSLAHMMWPGELGADISWCTDVEWKRVPHPLPRMCPCHTGMLRTSPDSSSAGSVDRQNQTRNLTRSK